MILANNLQRQYELYASEYEQKAIQVLRSGWYILGNEVEQFEQEWAKYIGVKYCVGLASGLDALWISFRLLGIKEGDEVIVSSNAYIACVMGITINGATPVFVEPDEYYNIDAAKIEKVITPKTKAILAVHLYGQSCDMDKICEIANKHSLHIIEDCAQSHGSLWRKRAVGSIGKIGCFSFYPTKGCGGFGDGGCIVTNDASLVEDFRAFRNYGSEKKNYNKFVGCNSRLDELQAGLLRVKLSHISELNEERQRIAHNYLENINNPLIILPKVRDIAYSTWHQFVVMCGKRDNLQHYLKENKIDTAIHYPIPPHLSEAYRILQKKQGDYPISEKYATQMLSLPMYNGMTLDEQAKVIKTINEFH